MSFEQKQVGDIIRYEHNGPPDDELVEIVGFRCKQKGKSYFISNLNAMQIDMLTTVPKYDFTKDYKDMAQDILEFGLGTRNVEQWQRETIMDNMMNIDEFWASENNHIVNNVVVALKENPTKPVLDNQSEENEVREDIVEIDIGDSVELMEKNIVRIKIHNWFSNVCPNGHRHPSGENIWFDSCPNEDCEYHKKPWRPAIIIDGQHRIRGTQFQESRNSGFNKDPIPITILGPTDDPEATHFRHSDMAKVFTEISAKARSLEETHKMFLLYAFKTNDVKYNMGDNSPTRKAYETILRLAGTGISGNPFQDKIKILKPSDSSNRTTALSFLRALRWFKDWFRHGAIWESLSTQDAANEIVNYVNAIRSIWSGRSPLGNLYWETSPPPAKRGIFSHGKGGEMSSYLRVMFDVYPIVRDNVPAPTKASFTSYIKARLSEQNDIGRAIWDGEGWESIRAPDSKYNYLKDIIKDIMQKEPDDNRIVNDIRNHNIGNDINSYLNLDPDVYEVELEISNVNESDSEGISCTDDGRYKVENGAEIKLTSRLGPFNIIHWVPFLHSKNFYYELVGTGQEEKTKRVEIGKYNEHRISIPRSTPSEQEKIILKLRGENHNGKQTEPYEINISW